MSHRNSNPSLEYICSTCRCNVYNEATNFVINTVQGPLNVIIDFDKNSSGEMGENNAEDNWPSFEEHMDMAPAFHRLSQPSCTAENEEHSEPQVISHIINLRMITILPFVNCGYIISIPPDVAEGMMLKTIHETWFPVFFVSRVQNFLETPVPQIYFPVFITPRNMRFVFPGNIILHDDPTYDITESRLYLILRFSLAYI